jgi:predicted DCC family thiol-disulfide oxidoreductase YuxK
VGYDSDCGVCRRGVRRWHAVFERRGFVFVPLRNPWLRGRLGLREGELPNEMKLLLADGRVAGGVEAIAVMMRAVWWLAASGWLISLPGARELARAVYRWSAQRRYRFGACPIQKPAEAPRRAHTVFLEMP